MSTPSKPKTIVKQISEKNKEVLMTEYIDIYYISSFDTGNEVNVISMSEKILDLLAKYTNPAAYIIVPLHMIKQLERKKWKRLSGISVWVKPFIKLPGQLPKDVEEHLNKRILIDMSLFSEEYLSKVEYARVYLGDISITFSEKEVVSKHLGTIKGYVEAFIHRNGVFVLTIMIPIHDLRLSSREIIKIRYLLESGKILIEIPSIIYATWLKLKIGKECRELGRRSIKIKTTITDVIEIYTLFLKKLAVEHSLGKHVFGLRELEKNLRNPWDIQYTMLFTEVLKGEKKIPEILSNISSQLYTIMFGTRRIISKKSLYRALKKSFYFVPIEDIGKPGFLKKKRVVTRVTIIATDTTAHIVSISRKYIGTTDIGIKLRLKHLTVFELLNHVKQSLRVLEHLTLKRPRNLDELVELKEKFSYLLDLIENSYFIVDKDMKELYEHVTRIFEVNRFILRVERRLDALNYMIMTRYQDKINKMQLTLTMMFGIFGVPFFIFSYVQWYFDYVTTGRSINFWPVTVATFIPTVLILTLTLLFYYKWRKEVFNYRKSRKSATIGKVKINIILRKLLR